MARPANRPRPGCLSSKSPVGVTRAPVTGHASTSHPQTHASSAAGAWGPWWQARTTIGRRASQRISLFAPSLLDPFWRHLAAVTFCSRFGTCSTLQPAQREGASQRGRIARRRHARRGHPPPWPLGRQCCDYKTPSPPRPDVETPQSLSFALSRPTCSSPRLPSPCAPLAPQPRLSCRIAFAQTMP